MTDLPLDPMQTATLERPVARRDPRLLTPDRRKKVRRWWRRKPVNSTLVIFHRWASLILGLLLVIECSAGAILLYQGDIFRATNGHLYRHSSAGAPVSMQQAIGVVAKADPTYGASWVATDNHVYVVGNSDYAKEYFVDPASGTINGSHHFDRGFLAWLNNLHDCAFSCQGYPWYQAWTAKEVWKGGPTFLTGITWGSLVLGVVGCLLILLVLSSIRIWWPGRTKLKNRVKVRTGKGRFARDYDLHNLVGALALPFLLMWGLTGASFEFPGIEKGWIALTGGNAGYEPSYSVTPRKAPAGTPSLTFDQAVQVAKTQVPNASVASVYLPTTGTPYWEVDMDTDLGAEHYRAVYHGDTYVYVDEHYADNVAVFGDDRGQPLANRFYDSYLEPSHFGWNVNGWWRIIWALFGLAPLLLMITGISTWLFRRGVKKRRKAALRAKDPAITPVESVDDELAAGHADEIDPALVHADGGTGTSAP